MTVELKIDGKRITTGKVVITTDSSPPPIDPPDPEPGPEPIPPDTEIRELGPLTKAIPRKSVTLFQGQVVSYLFWVPASTTVQMIDWGFTPQNQDLGNFHVWISETPNGVPVDINTPVSLVKVGMRRGMLFGLATPLAGRGAERRGPNIRPVQRYYMNIQLRGSISQALMWWRVGGNF